MMESLWNTLMVTVICLGHILIELMIFIAVDSVVKTSLLSLRGPEDRRRMWYLESLVLLVFATFMGQYIYVPYVLYILGFTTTVSALLHERIKWQTVFPKDGKKETGNNDFHASKDNSVDSNTRQSSHPTLYNNMTKKKNKKTFVADFFKKFVRPTIKGTPPGLPNRGSNLCFLNTIMQCFAHVQSSSGLVNLMLQMNEECKEKVFIDNCSELLEGCSKRQDSDSHTVLNTFAFRKAASQLCPHLITDPSCTHKQKQQDAAEFLMWLLATLHNTLKVVNTKDTRHLKTVSGVENFSEEEQKSLRHECKVLLQTAKSIYDDRCIKAVQVLSDLDWTYQQLHESSIVSELFSGQLLEIKEDTSRDYLSLCIQAFNVLPVPLSGPRQISGLVHLQDCISDMCALTEVLVQSPSVCDSTPTKTKRNFHADNFCNGGEFLSPSLVHLPVSSSTPTCTQPEFLTCHSQSPDSSGSREFHCQTSMRYLPKCLILQLNRFNQNGCKTKIPVSIPLLDLDLTPALFDQHIAGVPVSSTCNAGNLYDLVAVCVHEGSESTCFGHYVAFCLATNGLWYRMDDELVSTVNMTFECNTPSVRENAYLLFYVRKNLP